VDPTPAFDELVEELLPYDPEPELPRIRQGGWAAASERVLTRP
jgi:hypothetical protein